jgi:hypothetical protein
MMIMNLKRYGCEVHHSNNEYDNMLFSYDSEIVQYSVDKGVQRVEKRWSFSNNRHNKRFSDHATDDQKAVGSILMELVYRKRGMLLNWRGRRE